MEAIKRVYASTFSQHAKAYVRATPYRLEEEKMAVILQQVVGTIHGQRFYPDFSGVVRSHNFYPVPPMSYSDGIAAVALGLGRMVVDGGKCLAFCPRYPKHLLQFSSVDDILANSQREFWALEDVVEEHRQNTQQRHRKPHRLHQPLPECEADRYLRVRRQASVKLRLIDVVQDVHNVGPADR